MAGRTKEVIMKQILFTVLAVTVLLVLQPVRPALAAGHGERTPLSDCWSGTFWDELGIPVTTAIPRG